LNDTQAQLEKLQNEIAQAAKKTGIASAAKLATIQPKKDIVSKPCFRGVATSPVGPVSTGPLFGQSEIFFFSKVK